MFDPNAPLPDFQSQTADIARQKQVAEMLRSLGGKQPSGQMIGPHYVAPSFTQQLSPLMSQLASTFLGNKAAGAEKELGQGIQAAKTNWAENLPQTIPGHPEFPGPRDVGGSPELDAARPQVPDRSSVLKATMAGMRIPGNEQASMLWNKGMGEEVQREDNQAEKRDTQTALFKQQKDLELARLTQKADEAKQRSEDTRLSIEQRREAASQMAEFRRMHDATLRSIAQMKSDKPKDLKPLPSAQSKAWVENGSRLKFLDQALVAVDAYPKAFGSSNVLGNAVRSRTDPKGVDARAIVGNIGSLKVHDRSGAAVTAAESPRLQPFIPIVNGPYADDSKTIAKKLKLFKQEINNMQDEIADFADNQGYKNPRGPAPANGGELPPGLVLPPGAKYIGPAQ